MNSKDILKLQKKDGFFEIDSFVKSSEIEYIKKPNLFRIKTDDNMYIYFKQSGLTTFTHYAEVICSHLARQFGIKSVRYYFAKFKGRIGVLSADYKKQNENDFKGRDLLIEYKNLYNSSEGEKDTPSYLTINNNSFEEFIDFIKIKLQNKQITKTVANQALRHFIKTMIFDIVTLNFDRHNTNWGFLKKNSSIIRHAPLFDNEYSFHLQKSKQCLLDYYRGIHSSKEYFMDSDKEVYSRFKINKNTNLVDYIQQLKDIQQKFPKLFNKQLKKINKLDINKAFDSVEEETNVKLPQLVKSVVRDSLNIRLNNIKSFYNKLDNEVNKNDFSF